MPIFAYRCERCGFEQDVLQKRTDAPLTDCPACGAAAFSKRLTAPAFQLKGSGWYVTDFRDNGKKGGESATSLPKSTSDAGEASTPSTPAAEAPKAAASPTPAASPSAD